jgi:hypothetical protein
MLLHSVSDEKVDEPQRRAFLATDARAPHDVEHVVTVHFSFLGNDCSSM